MWNKRHKTILALGADIKNRFLLTNGGLLHFGPDIGDLSEAENFELFKREVRKAVKDIKPDIIACDLHPNYFSSLFAKECSLQLKAHSLEPIQHHHAHVASVMQEHNLKGPVLGVSFDGTGYGQDGNSWGGEFLLVERHGFKRLAHLKYRMMPGGDKVTREPWRMALSILGKKAVSFMCEVDRKDKQTILFMMAKNINSPLTSSAGRLFDAAAALLGVCVYASYEAEGPIKLEAMCDKKVEGYYKFSVFKKGSNLVIDTDEMFSGMLKDLKKGKNKRLIATRFHNSMAEIVVGMVKKLSRSFGIKDIALSGGVFQNNFLKNKVVAGINDSGMKVFTNIQTPVNDLNISLGQYYVSCCSGKS
ncbi:MAG: hypothetical protein KKH11_01060 [Candidatus Omnitrophica bacterium]|nr:hypothetical protein [Candidatus Omnitrophota bacterium]